MPYEVSGWIEVVWDHTLDEEVQSWAVVVDLHRLCLLGDYTSHTLFGLSKRIETQSYFENRGIPSDPSPEVKKYYEDNEIFIADVGEGDFGFTYASWKEMKELIEKVGIERDISNEWKQAFSLANSLSRGLYSAEEIRFVVYANW